MSEMKTEDIIESLLICTQGNPDACSFLYGRAARVAKDLGYSRIITYILESESGVSLRAAGWEFDGMTSGGSWNCPSRPRQQKAPTCAKQRYVKDL